MATTALLKNIPADVYAIIQEEQHKIKKQKGTNSFSLECTIYKMIRDYVKCRKEYETFQPEPV